MKTSTETKRVDEKASHTALIAAIYRFLASKERRPGFTGPDDMADVLAEKDAIKKTRIYQWISHGTYLNILNNCHEQGAHRGVYY